MRVTVTTEVELKISQSIHKRFTSLPWTDIKWLQIINYTYDIHTELQQTAGHISRISLYLPWRLKVAVSFPSYFILLLSNFLLKASIIPAQKINDNCCSLLTKSEELANAGVAFSTVDQQRSTSIMILNYKLLFCVLSAALEEFKCTLHPASSCPQLCMRCVWFEWNIIQRMRVE